MAKKLESFDFGSSTKTAHDWDQYLDGSVWQLVQGSDFTCKLSTIGSLARLNAKKRGVTVRVSIDKDNQTVTLQAVKAGAAPAKVLKTPAKAANRGKKSSGN